MTRRKKDNLSGGGAPPPPYSPKPPPVSAPPPRPVPPAPRWEDVQRLSLEERLARIRTAWDELWDWAEDADRAGAFDGLVWSADRAPEVGEQMYCRGFFERQRLEVEAHLADPALSERLRRWRDVVRVAEVDDPPAPNQVLMRPGEAPRVMARGGESERPLTYGDIQDWAYSDQYRALTHAREVERQFRENRPRTHEAQRDEFAIDRLLRDAVRNDSSLKVALDDAPSTHVSKAIDVAT